MVTKEVSRRFLTFLSSVMFVLSVFTTTFVGVQHVSAFAGGDGSTDTPYQIADCQQLQDMNGDLAAHYELTGNVDCGETTNWNEGAGFLPVGDWGSEFSGTLNGNGYSISNLFINRPTSDRQALIGYTTNGAVIQNLGMENVQITAQRYAGGIVGVLNGADSVIRNSFVTGSITLVFGDVGGSGQFAGGIVSGLDFGSHIYNSYSAADVLTFYHDAWGEGGLAGYAYNGSSVSNSFWDTETTSTVLLSEGGGTGKTNTQMKTLSTYVDAGWNFSSVWGINAGDMPYLRNSLHGGNGSADYPYEISSCLELQDINDNNATLSKHYILVADIDCDGVTFTPIGSSGSEFTGNFDGGNHTISNVSITSGASGTGLFGDTTEATITNVNLSNFTISGTDRVGALVGTTNYTTISYIGLYNGTITGSGSNVGGLVGYLGGSSISNSFAENSTVTANTMAGGLAGITIGPSTVGNSYFQGSIDATANVGGITGQVGAGPASVNNTYADVSFIDAGSAIVDSIASGASESNNFIASTPYLENSSESPMDAWDFANTWYIRTNNYPGLRPLNLPILLCQETTVGDTTALISCTGHPLLNGPTTWELDYGFSDTTTWADLPDESGDSFTTTVTGLLPGTDYNVRFRYKNDVGTSPWGRIELTTTGSSDLDSDGATNKLESLSPNSGDADNDGIADYTQANVTSFVSVNSSNYVVLRTSCNDNFNVQHGLESADSKDSGFDYPSGLVGFVARGCNVGAKANVSILFYGQNSSGLKVRKYRDGTYLTIPDATVQQLTIDGKTVAQASYQVTDGSSLDDDGLADGNIVDPVGLGLSTVSAPNTGIQQL